MSKYILEKIISSSHHAHIEYLPEFTREIETCDDKGI
jgi:hypothetical protein